MIGPAGPGSTIATCTGSETNHMVTPCGSCTLRTITPGPPASASISAYRGSSGLPWLRIRM